MMTAIDFRRDLLPHKDRLFRMAMGILLDSAEAEDTVEDTLIRAWETSKEGTHIDNVGAYLTTLCRNLAIDRSRRAAAQDEPLTEMHTQVADTQSAAVSDRYERVMTIIQRLPEPQRSCLLLRDVEGLSYHDIESTLALSESQVKVYIHRARQAVRETYNKHFS